MVFFVFNQGVSGLSLATTGQTFQARQWLILPSQFYKSRDDYQWSHYNGLQQRDVSTQISC